VLRIIAGLLEPDRGQVLFGEKDVTGVRPGERRIGMVFQNYALYPHLTSEKNILAYFLFHRKTPELDELAHQKYERTSKLMGVEIAYLLDRKPSGLSQGEKQRVALARCISRDPAVFLLDEPFSSLDQNLREKYRLNLKRLLGEFEITTVFVTHDQQEAMLLADQIAVMERGKLVQVGPFLELYHEPVNAFVAGFLNPDPLTPAINVVKGGLVAPGFAGCELGVRPEDVYLDDYHQGYGIELVVEDVVDLPTRPEVLLSGRCGDRRFHACVLQPEGSTVTERVWLSFERFQVFDAESGVRLQSYPGVGSD
jgi:ABC-type sugar transport system ATPase subunit